MNTVAPELIKLTRNPAVQLVDYRDKNIASNFKQHKADADAVADKFRAGDLFTLVQRSAKGYWVSEWTVGGKGGDRNATRRRAGDGKSLEDAIDAIMNRSSHHNSHYYRPEESFLKMIKRVYFPSKSKA